MLAILITVVVFTLYKLLAGRLLGTGQRAYRWYISVLDYAVFMSIWMTYYRVIAELMEYKNWEVYVSLNLIGIFSVIWCYFSWDVSRTSIRPRRAKEKEQRCKKAILYTMILLFVLYHGYRQTLHLFNGEKVDEMLLLVYYSIVIGTTAFDRLLGQVITPA